MTRVQDAMHTQSGGYAGFLTDLGIDLPVSWCTGDLADLNTIRHMTHNSEYPVIRRILAIMAKTKSIEFPDLDWFLKNFNELFAKHPNEWIAIKNRTVVAHAATTKELRRRIEQAGVTCPFIARTTRQALETAR